MRTLDDLMPKTKFDDSGIGELNQLSDEEIEPVLPELLAWMKDMNWPIANEMPGLLAKHQKIIAPHIIDILQPEQLECDWKTNLVQHLLPLMDKEYLMMVKPCLMRIAENPTWGEKSEDTDTAARKLLLIWGGA